jgi:hypothetical protein
MANQPPATDSDHALRRRARHGDEAAIAILDAAEKTREIGLHWRTMNIPMGSGNRPIHRIYLERNPSGFGAETILFNERVIGKSEEPFTSAACWLLANNVAAEIDVIEFYRAEIDVKGYVRWPLSMSGIAGDLAKLTVEESKAMADRIFLRLSEKYALGADDFQWVIYRSRRKVPSPLDAPLKIGRDSEWEPVSFVRSTKAILLARCGPVTCDEAKLALAGYPDTFDAWKAAVRPVTLAETTEFAIVGGNGYITKENPEHGR